MCPKHDPKLLNKLLNVESVPALKTFKNQGDKMQDVSNLANAKMRIHELTLRNKELETELSLYKTVTTKLFNGLEEILNDNRAGDYHTVSLNPASSSGGQV